MRIVRAAGVDRNGIGRVVHIDFESVHLGFAGRVFRATDIDRGLIPGSNFDAAIEALHRKASP